MMQHDADRTQRNTERALEFLERFAAGDSGRAHRDRTDPILPARLKATSKSFFTLAVAALKQASEKDPEIEILPEIRIPRSSPNPQTATEDASEL
jgi:hypothetical protein